MWKYVLALGPVLIMCLLVSKAVTVLFGGFDLFVIGWGVPIGIVTFMVIFFSAFWWLDYILGD